MTSENDSSATLERALRIAAENADQVDRDGRFPAEAIAALREAKLMAALIPAELGGDGRTIRDMAVICNKLARHCASTAMIFAMHQIQVACLVDQAITEEWHKQFAIDLVANQWLLASMTSETGIGGNIRTSTCAVQMADDGTFTLEKRTPTMSYGAQADAYFITARRTPDSPPSDQVFVTVMRRDVELEQTGGWDGLGLRGTGSGAFNLRGKGVVGQIFDRAFADISAQSMLPVSHLLWVSTWLGIAGSAAEKARLYLRDQAKKNPGAPPHGAARLHATIGPLQLLQARVRDLLNRHTTQWGDQALSLDTDLNALKLDGSRICLEVVQQSLMICGMAGYRNGGPFSLGRHLRDMWAAPLMIGNDRVAANTGAMLLAQRAELGAID